MESAESTVHGSLDLRTVPDDHTGVIGEEIATRRRHLQRLGFSEEWITELQENRPTFFHVDNIDAKIAMINRLNSHYKLEISAPELMQRENAIFGSKSTSCGCLRE